MSPPFLFRIDEIDEDPNGASTINNNPLLSAAPWIPSIGAIRSRGGDVSGKWWFCNGQGIQGIQNHQLPAGMTQYKSFSMFWCDGFGYLLYRGDATRPNAESVLKPLRFGHDRDDNYSSYLSEAEDESALLCRRRDQAWVSMLLPDIYHGQTETPYEQYGALKGDLGIFLGLIAFAIRKDLLPSYLPSMFTHGEWKTWSMPNGRAHQRGVVVYIYTCPRGWPTANSQGSTATDLIAYEQGRLGKYYN